MILILYNVRAIKLFFNSSFKCFTVYQRLPTAISIEIGLVIVPAGIET